MKFIIDTDAGIDDAIALLMALAHPAAELLAVTTVVGNVPLEQATRNAGVILDVAAAPDISVFRGCARPLVQCVPPDAVAVHGDDGLGGAGRPATNRVPYPEPAGLALARLAREHPGQITLVTLGPLTNIALAIQLDADFLANLRHLVIMGGSVDGRGNTTPAAEFNFLVDPEAAAFVFAACRRARIEAVLVSWETTLAHPIPLTDWDNLVAGAAPVAKFVQQMTGHIKRTWRSSNVFWPDPLAVAVALAPEIISEQESRFVTVEHAQAASRGHTIVDYRPNAEFAPNARLVRKVDMAKFQNLLQLAVQQGG